MFSSYALRIFSQQILSGKDGPKGNKSPIHIDNKQNFELDAYLFCWTDLYQSASRQLCFLPTNRQLL